MLFINDLLDLKDRKLYLEVEGKKIPMRLHWYIADDIFFFNVDFHDDITVSNLDTLRDMLETEAEDECWHHDIYQAPMDKIGNCEIKFPKDMKDVIEHDVFDNCYIITHMDVTMDEIVIYLK